MLFPETDLDLNSQCGFELNSSMVVFSEATPTGVLEEDFDTFIFRWLGLSLEAIETRGFLIFKPFPSARSTIRYTDYVNPNNLTSWTTSYRYTTPIVF
jgi:hypothetical protein